MIQEVHENTLRIGIEEYGKSDMGFEYIKCLTTYEPRCRNCGITTDKNTFVNVFL